MLAGASPLHWSDSLRLRTLARLALAALLLSMTSTGAAPQVMTLPEQVVGQWGAWIGACKVDPFEGPSCGLQQKFVPPRSAPQGTPATRPGPVTQMLDELGSSRVWVTLTRGSTYLSFEPERAFDGALLVRIDGNDIWRLESQRGALRRNAALVGPEAAALLTEMRSGASLYLTVDARGARSDAFSLVGFKQALETVVKRFSELDAQFPGGPAAGAPTKP